MAYLRLVANRDDDSAFERAVNTPPRGIGGRTIDEVRRLARAQGVSLWQAAARLSEGAAAGGDGGALAGRARNALRGFETVIESLAAELPDMQLHEQFDHVLERSGLRTYYMQESKGQLESRVENLDELVSVASRFERARRRGSGRHERACCIPRLRRRWSGRRPGRGRRGRRAADDAAQRQGPGVPSRVPGRPGGRRVPRPASAEDAGRLEEERRLAYVGLTRARRRLVLTWAESRRIHGSEMLGAPSRFLREIPQALLREVRPRAPARVRRCRRACAMPATSPASAPVRRCGWGSASRMQASAKASSPTARAAARTRACR
jgi:DNA helicase-2/ATP-dependent DNA helicase PcrA